MDLALDELKVVVIGIHGVGDTRANYVRDAVAANLRASGIDVEVDEYCWNERVQKPLAEGALRFQALKGIVYSLISAGTLGFRRKPGEHNPLGTLLNHGFEWSHILISLGVISFVLLPLLTMTVLLPFREWLGTSLFHFEWIWPAAIGLILVGGCLLLVSTVLSLFSGNRATIAQSCRRALFIIIAPLISILCSPFLIPWKEVVKKLWWLPAMLLAMVFIDTIKGGGYAIDLLKGPFMVIASIPVALFVLGILTEFAIGPAIKILLDIFYYVSDPRYRSHLQDGLRDLIVQLREQHGHNLYYVVLAHSLGSVITVDSLVNFGCWEEAHQITLITMGSPLRRFFARFFPGVLFPASIDVTYKAISKRIPNFRWINIYRPWDQVGTSLGVKDTDGIVEISTGQRRILTAHVDYWSDPDVRDKVLVEIKRPQTNAIPNPAPDVQVEKVRPDYTPVPHFSAQYINAPSWLVTATLIGVITISFALTIAARVAWNQQMDRDLVALASTGTEGKAQVNLVMEKIGGGHQGEPPIIKHSFTISYGHNGGHKAVVSPDDRRSSRRIRFDWHKLEGDIIRKGEQVQHSSIASEYILSGVSIRYLPYDPRVFDFPAYPYHGSMVGELGSVVAVMMLIIFLLSFIFTLGAILIKWFLGLPMES